MDLQAVEAATKKHEAIETDIAAYEERVQAVVAVSKELELECYHDIKRIAARKDNVLRLWEYLLELLKARRQRLEMNLGLQRVFQEMLYIMDWMDEMKVSQRPQTSGTLFHKTGECQLVCLSRCCFCPRIMGNTCWAWRTSCRNTPWWRRTSLSRPTE